MNCTTGNRMKAALPKCVKSLVMITVWIQVTPPPPTPPPPCRLSSMPTPVGFSFNGAIPGSLWAARSCCCWWWWWCKWRGGSGGAGATPDQKKRKKKPSRAGLVGEDEFERRRRGPNRHNTLSVSHLESSRAARGKRGSHKKYGVLFFRSRDIWAEGSRSFCGRGEGGQTLANKFIPPRVTVARRRPGGRRRDADESDGVVVVVMRD